MKKIVFASVLAFSTIASAQWSMDLPNLWWPDEFTSDEISAAEAEMITTSQNVKLYLKKNKLGPILDVAKVDGKLYVFIEGGSFQVVIKKNQTPAVRPVKGTLFVD